MNEKYKEEMCPECGKRIAANWFVRHLKEQHPIENNELVPGSRWKNPRDWLTWRWQNASHARLIGDALSLLVYLSNDQVQEHFLDDMEQDGYFEK